MIFLSGEGGTLFSFGGTTGNVLRSFRDQGIRVTCFGEPTFSGRQHADAGYRIENRVLVIEGAMTGTAENIKANKRKLCAITAPGVSFRLFREPDYRVECYMTALTFTPQNEKTLKGEEVAFRLEMIAHDPFWRRQITPTKRWDNTAVVFTFPAEGVEQRMEVSGVFGIAAGMIKMTCSAAPGKTCLITRTFQPGTSFRFGNIGGNFYATVTYSGTVTDVSHLFTAANPFPIAKAGNNTVTVDPGVNSATVSLNVEDRLTEV